MLEFDSDDDYLEKVHEEYTRLYASLGDERAVLLVPAAGSYEMYWVAGSQGAAAEASAHLGLRSQLSSSGTHMESWFRASRTDKLDMLAERWTVRFMVPLADGTFAIKAPAASNM
jgi:hypothetical protein